MDNTAAIRHFLYYLEHHPALTDRQSARVLIGHTAEYTATSAAIIEQAGDPFHFTPCASTSRPPRC